MSVSPALVPVAILLGGLGLTAVISYLGDRQRRLSARIDQIAGAAAGADGEQPVRPASFVGLRRWLSTQAVSDRVQRDLDGAGLTLRAEEFILVVGMSAGVLSLATFVVIKDFRAALLIGLVGYFLPWRLVHYLRQRRRIRLEEQLADVLTLMASSLRAGHTAIQSMEVSTQQLPPPVTEEFARVVFNVNLGVSLAEALREMAHRVQSYEYDMMVSAVTIQLEVGGSIAELLENIAATIRDRAALRDEMRALTAQGRLSGVLLSLLPVGLFMITMITNRPYMMVLLEDQVGQNILKAALLMEFVGWMAIRKILNVRV